jgi:glyoxylase-like metal-dependent hydrolase (beta-lactamase superfamily II)
MDRSTIVTTMFCGVTLALGAALPAAAQGPAALYQKTQYTGQEIGKLTGDVYYARWDDYLSAFMVTPEGVILVEPVGVEFATWLKGEIKKRFNQPVKYVVYSHSHADHASGAAVYADTAQLIGHEALVKLLEVPAATALPDNVKAQDANTNGAIERAEAQGNIAALFDLYDADKNGALSGGEIARGPLGDVAKPTRTYTGKLELKLGCKIAEVMTIPTAHAPDNTIVRFVDGSNVLFASDWITVDRTPFGPGITAPDEIAKAKLVEAMDFEHFVCSHGKLGKKADVRANIKYREDVRDAVAKAIAEGKTLEQTRDTVLMPDYAKWEFYDVQRPQNVTGAYRIQTAAR